MDFRRSNTDVLFPYFGGNIYLLHYLLQGKYYDLTINLHQHLFTLFYSSRKKVFFLKITRGLIFFSDPYV